MTRPHAGIAAAVAALALVISPRGVAQVDVPHDELYESLSDARSDIARIQADADSVEEQIASIDDQAAAVAQALAASTALVDRTRAEIDVLRRSVATQQYRFTRLRERATDIAISLYKDGPNAQLESMLGASTLREMSAIVEYSSTVSQETARIMVATKRLEAQLIHDKAALQVKLADAIELRGEQRSQAQHLRELRAAQTAKLGELRKRIEGMQREARATAAASANVASVVSTGATLGVGSSGFAWPIRGAITSGYGPRWGGTHSGIDIDCVTGAAIAASKAGRVVTATYDGSGYGNYVVIDHGDGYATLYAHASSLSVSSGASVAQGQTIAACGSTGASTGDHLHFEVRVNGSPQDPMRYLP